VNVLPAAKFQYCFHCLHVQIDARKRIDKRGVFRDVVADVKDFPDTKLLELILLADPAAIDAQQRYRDVHRDFLRSFHLLQPDGSWPGESFGCSHMDLL
jgi:hypothetical protein